MSETPRGRTDGRPSRGGPGDQRTTPRREEASASSAERRAGEDLLELAYSRLRAMARKYMRGERADHTLQPTALVHEAYLKVMDDSRIDWLGRSHFEAVVARKMRHILVDHARARGAKKRGDGAKRISLVPEAATVPGVDPTILLTIDEALSRLAKDNERRAKVAELRLFAGLRVGEISASLAVSERTVKSDWRFARDWLRHLLELRVDPPHSSDSARARS